MANRRSWHSAVAGFALVTAAVAVSSGQVPAGRESFDTISIRERPRDSAGSLFVRVGPLSFSATNATVLDLIQNYFQIPEKQIVGISENQIIGNLPGWAKSTRFDVIARAAGEPLTRTRLAAMIKTLLEDRFRLDASFERVTMSAYGLVMARSDGSRGPNLRPSQSKCEVDPPLMATPEQPVKLAMSNIAMSNNCGFTIGTNNGWLIMLRAARATMDQFAGHLSRYGGFDRPVVNRTGLSGEFSLMVIPTTDMPGATSDARFLIAMREQLGLTIRAEQLPVDVLRIHRIERPSEN